MSILIAGIPLFLIGLVLVTDFKGVRNSFARGNGKENASDLKPCAHHCLRNPFYGHLRCHDCRCSYTEALLNSLRNWRSSMPNFPAWAAIVHRRCIRSVPSLKCLRKWRSGVSKFDDQGFTCVSATGAYGYYGAASSWGQRKSGENFYSFGWAAGRGLAVQGPTILGGSFNFKDGASWSWQGR